MKIRKLADGSGFATFTPIINELPAPRAASTSEKKSESDDIQSLMDKGLVDFLYKEGGLSNDITAFVQDLMKQEMTAGLPYTSGGGVRATLQIINKINTIRNSKKDWEDAVSRSKESGGLGEVAVDTYGRVFIKGSDNKIKAITLADYNKSTTKLPVLSVQELLYERQHNSSLVGNDAVFTVADNSIGLSKITNYMKDLITAFGEESQKDTRIYSKDQILKSLGEMTGKKPSTEQLASMQKLSEVLNTPGELYKITTEKSTQRNQLNKAVDYLWSALSTPAQQKLRATAVLNGKKDPSEFILEALLLHTDESTKQEIEPTSLPKTKGEGDGGLNPKNLTYFEILHNGKVGTTPVIWNDPITNKKITMQATGVAPVPADISGKPLGLATLSQIMKTENAALVDANQAYFGDKKISLNDADKIIYDGKNSMRVYMPANADGSPNYKLLQQFNDVQSEVDANKANMTPQQINEFYAQHGFDYINVDNNGQIIVNSLIKPFWVMYGYTTGESSVADNNGVAKALSSEEEDQTMDALEEVWKKEKISPPTTSFFRGGTTLYKGMIAIPYKPDSSIYAASMANNLLAQQATLEEAKIRQRGRVVSGGSDFLNQ